MIKRDQYNIICQHDPNNLQYMDGGDSASRTGIMALCGNDIDKQLLKKFLDKDFKVVRHPYQEQWNDSSKTSRDQLVCWFAGASTQSPTLADQVRKNYGFFVNKDFLMPDVQNHLKLCSGKSGSILGYLMLNVSIMWAAYVKPEAELNQLLSMCLVAGPKYVKRLMKYHKSVDKNLNEYWASYPFRDQREIYLAIVDRVMLDITA